MTRTTAIKNIITRIIAIVTITLLMISFGCMSSFADYPDYADASFDEYDFEEYSDEDHSGDVDDTADTDDTDVTPDENDDDGDGENMSRVFVVGTELNSDNMSGTGWNYDEETGTLTLDSYNYEGTGLFDASDESVGDTEDEETDAEDDVDSEDSDDESDDDDWEADEDWEDDEVDDEDYDEESTDEDTGDAEDGESSEDTTEPVKGVICPEGDLTLRLNGENHITVTDEDSDASYAVNVAGELKVEGDGVLYVSSATEEKVYGTEPGAEADTEENSGNNDTNTVGLIAALAATVVIGAVALIVMIRRRQLGL